MIQINFYNKKTTNSIWNKPAEHRQKPLFFDVTELSVVGLLDPDVVVETVLSEERD
jgi:hypothetical protein